LVEVFIYFYKNINILLKGLLRISLLKIQFFIAVFLDTYAIRKNNSLRK